MAWKRQILVVANVTVTSDELLAALQARAAHEPVGVTLVVPATPFGGGREAAEEKLRTSIEQLTNAGIEAGGAVGDPDPIIAVTDVWDPRRYDEIIVSTLPMRFSKWLHAGLPERIGKITGAPVTHIISRPPKPIVETVPAPEHHNPGIVFGTFSGLGVSAGKDHEATSG